MKKNEFVIELIDGILGGVYSIDPTMVDVTLYENEDVHDGERIKNYWRNNLLVERGCISDISRGPDDSNPSALPLRLGGKQVEGLLRLFADNPVAKEKLHFLEGFLYAWAMVNQKITRMCRSSDGGERRRGKEMFENFKPTLQSWLSTYDELFDELWQYADFEGEM